MAIRLSSCARMLKDDGVRHHVDHEEGVIRAAFVTRHYVNPRGEKLAIVRIDTPDEGHRCRVSMPRAFAWDADAEALSLRLCRLASATPLVGIEAAADGEEWRLVIETVVEDGRLTRLQLLTMVDRLVEAAEAWHVALHESATGRRDGATGRRAAPVRGRQGAA